MANVLAVFAHPDDEVLGCGGTLAKHADAGDEVRIHILAERGLGREIVQAAQALGGGGLWTLSHDLVDQCFDAYHFRDLTDLFPTPAGGWMEHDHNPDIIYTHHPEDLNLDHALTARAVLTAFRPKPGEKPRTILACEVLSSTEYTYPPAFQPNWYETLSGRQLEKKVEAMLCYETELETFPHPRSTLGIRNLAAYRGQSVGVERAEAFQLLRRT